MADVTKGSQNPTEFPITFDTATGTIKDEGALAAIAAAGGGGSTPLVNNLTSTSTTSALTAAQGKVLQDTKAPRGGPGAALGATYTAIEADDGKIWPTPVNCAVTVNTGLPSGFGQGFSGAGVVSFTGTATITDKRTTGATNPVCSLVNVGTNTYEIWGTKA